MGNTGVGILYLLFSRTFLPLIAACTESFLMTGRVNRYNARLATEIATRLRAYRPAAEQPANQTLQPA